ncbi:MAG: 30S ribosomal protein S7 [Candidatus Omnitrophica bacterium]|nr:30S ribosomal protein S7 [Candidatus Omnitrophota bacterium]MCK5288393.1 30S ribosomal protein S7 [Candidatus Omnitrophota bacterium]
MRRRKAQKRVVKPDPRFDSEIVGQFINIIMVDGKKSTAQKIIYDALDLVAEKANEEPLKVFFTALENARPRMAVKPRRIGGATYQIPLEVPKDKGVTMALRWVKDFALKKKGKPMKIKLADELMYAFKREGSVIKKRDDTHKMAEANKAFAHFKY